MIRIATETGYTLVSHQEHARLAGRFAAHWGNAVFPAPAAPEAMPHVIAAVARHDDAWAARDAAPFLTREGRPSAFTRELVGTYSAFEEIDLADYLAVRGAATEAVAAEDPFAAILISMHTHNLLTEQADLSTIQPAERPLHAAFVAGQLERQCQLASALPPALAVHATPEKLRRAFEFLQFCDNLSLLTCVGYDRPRPVRHTHPDVTGARHTITCTPTGDSTYHLAPWPFDQPALDFTVPARHVASAACADLVTFRAAYAAAPVTPLIIRLVA
ncbi:MAG: DUF3891 family protein [Opitutaceae bacterium]|jgi:hypothetical protein|nr:DUF3891 family protein [Opitutaceae bacterium]